MSPGLSGFAVSMACVVNKSRHRLIRTQNIVIVFLFEDVLVAILKTGFCFKAGINFEVNSTSYDYFSSKTNIIRMELMYSNFIL